MPSAVTIDDLAAWLNITVRGESIDALLTECLDAATTAIGARLGAWVPITWPSNVEQAVLMQGAKLYKRRNSPEGYAGFGDMGVVRVTALDPDVETMLGPDLAFWFGGALPVDPEPVAATELRAMTGTEIRTVTEIAPAPDTG
jgi:hypothetical protein